MSLFRFYLTYFFLIHTLIHFCTTQKPPGAGGDSAGHRRAPARSCPPPRNSSAVPGKDRGSLPGAGTRRKSRAPEPGAGPSQGEAVLGGDRDPPAPALALSAADFTPPVMGHRLGPRRTRGDIAGRRRSGGGGQGSVIFPARLQPPPSPARRRAGAPGCTPSGEVKIPFRPNTAQTLNHIKCVPLFFLPHLRPVPPRFQAVHQEQSPAPGRVGAAPPACEARTQAGWDLHGQQEASEQSDLHLLWKAP